jgi:hypothetical protein
VTKKSNKRKYHQGKFFPYNKTKYKGDPNTIIYRSGLELKYFKHFDLNPNILEWSSEEIVVPYINPKDNRVHRYFVDNYLKVKTTDGRIKEYLVEIKPLKFTVEPVKRKGQHQKTFERAVLTWLINDAKWQAARKYCKKSNMEFIFLTEKDLKVVK